MLYYVLILSDEILILLSPCGEEALFMARQHLIKVHHTYRRQAVPVLGVRLNYGSTAIVSGVG